jgi:hypothetical protein
LKITTRRIRFRASIVTLLCAIAAIGICFVVVSPVLRCLAFGAVFFSLLFLTKTLTREDLCWLKGLIYQK